MPDTKMHRIELLGVAVDALSLAESVEAARSWAREGGVHQHVVLNAAKVVQAQQDARLACIIRDCDLISPDGVSILWAARALGFRLPERVTGIDLMLALFDAAERDGSSVFLLGAADDVLATCLTSIKVRHPQLRVVGTHHGYWTDEQALLDQIRIASPDYLFVALPSPKKEYWLAENLPELGVPFSMGVGGSFDVLAGKTRRAPRVIQQAGMEWFWRLIQEPRRMWRRYLVGNTKFVILVLRARVTRQHSVPDRRG
jgi:N-acetylglucosaminyldiphosphoundecaprenol N-acetyl-beta-D-mannosaminyltransferase